MKTTTEHQSIIASNVLPQQSLSSHSTHKLHRLRDARLEQKISVGEMAMRLGISPSDVWIREDPAADINLDFLLRWSNALGISPSQLVVEQESRMGLVGVNLERLGQMMELAVSISELSRQSHDQSTDILARDLLHQLQQLIESRS